jgi:hypothetical protein
MRAFDVVISHHRDTFAVSIRLMPPSIPSSSCGPRADAARFLHSPTSPPTRDILHVSISVPFGNGLTKSSGTRLPTFRFGRA